MPADPSQICVLVVDDEFLIRLFAVDVLNDNGFDTLEASDGAEALAVFDDHPQIGALLTDIEMPGEFNGFGLACQLRDRSPELTILMASGRVLPSTCEMPERSCFIAKPFTGAQLLTALASAQLLSSRAV